MRYIIDKQRLKAGIDELMKVRLNEVLDNGGPITFASALLNYRATQQLAIKFGVDTAQYDAEILRLQESLGAGVPA